MKNKSENVKKKISVYWKMILCITGLTVIMIIFSLFPHFCDWYADSVYPHLCDGISRLTSGIPFALGEIMMYLGALMLLFSVVFLPLLLILRKKARWRKFCSIYYKSFLMLLVCIVCIYIPTWLIPFCGTVLGEGDAQKRTEFSYEEISLLMQYIIDGGNAAAEEIEILSDGTVDFLSETESQQHIAEAMQKLTGEYPRLAGYYPRVKPAFCSDILERMGIWGYTYPFTMELTHNKYVSPMDMPVLKAHELAHHKGYYKENEACFLSQIALNESDDPFLRLSGFQEMFWYIYDDYADAQNDVLEQLIRSGKIDLHVPLETEEDVQKYFQICEELFGEEPDFSERAHQIMHSAYKIETEIYETDAHPIEDIPQAENVITSVSGKGWEIQSEILQENSYEGCVLLILQYYDGKLY
ncbi:MAG: DUF3810 family protein [Oscillospiraceae bacterium]|nr:DUF3810 family protein [Oscillospiraceae bacterium]